jgi:hypothetical protein
LRDVWDYPPFHQSRWTPTAIAKAFARSGWEFIRVSEEPFALRGQGIAYADRRYGLASRPRLVRQALILWTTLCLIPASFRYRGMSLYALGRRSG